MTGDFDLLTALAAAVERRRGAGWPALDRAAAALDVLRVEQSAQLVDGTELSRVAARFGLDEQDALLLGIAARAELDPTAHLICGLLSGDPGGGRPSVAVALELAGIHPTDPSGRARFAESAPLARHGLLTLIGPDTLPSRRVRVPDRVAAQLAGDDRPTAALLATMVDPAPVRVEGTDTVAAALRAGEHLVWVHASVGAAGIGMAAGACESLDVPCLVADLHRLPTTRSAGEGEEVQLGPDAVTVIGTVSDLVLESGLSGAVLVLAGAELATPARAVLATSAVPVIAVSTQLPPSAWGADLPITVRAPRLSVSDREQLWSPWLGSAAVPREVTALRLTPEDIATVAGHAQREAALTGGSISADGIRRSARRLGQRRTGNADDSAGVTLADLILPTHVQSEVARLLDWARYRDELLAQGPLQGRGGKGTGICALFSGGPGTGKTLAAHVVADLLGMELMQVDLSGVVSKYIGETEKNLERIFAAAESLNAVLFFDEADALFGARSQVRDAHDRYANQEIAFLLQRMEHFDGLTVLATNLRGNLDPAFARRLHFIITFPDPDQATRMRLWEHHLDAVAALDPDDPVDTAGLAEAAELAGGDIRNIVLSAAYAAVAEGVALGQRHVVAAVIREYSKLGRRVPPRPILGVGPEQSDPAKDLEPDAAAPAPASKSPTRITGSNWGRASLIKTRAVR